MPQIARATPALVKAPAALVDLALATTTTGYALWLWAHRRRPEPSSTWVKVVVGNAMVLAAAAARHRLTGGDYERTVWWAFVVGGAPIITGELIQTIERYRESRSAYTAPPGWD